MSKLLRPFHLAFPVRDLEEAKLWYCNTLDCKVGRESADWIDFDFFGHQVVAHLSKRMINDDFNEVDGHNVPVRHFGIILTQEKWEKLKVSLEQQHISFIIDPNTRFENLIGEQNTLFIKDPSGNALEFKAFKDDSMIFSK